MDIAIKSRANAPFQGPHTDIGHDGDSLQRDRSDTLQRDRRRGKAALGTAANPGAYASTAFVYRPACNPMQSGPRTRKWVLQLEAQRPLSLEPLMGWTSGADPARHVRLEFSTCEAAIAFGESQGWRVYVLPENPRKPVFKSYRDNFGFKQPQSAEMNAKTSIAAKATSDETCDNGARWANETKDGTSKHRDPLDEALESTFPASDPLPFWSGRIGPPARVEAT